MRREKEFYLLFLVVLSITYISYSEKNIKMQESETEWHTTEAPASESMVIANTETEYFLKEENGYLVVYQKEGTVETYYSDTTILVALLPEEIKTRLKEGIVFQSKKELYDFLENYSS